MKTVSAIRAGLMALVLSLAAAMPAMADTSTYVDEITGAVDWATVITGVGVIAGLLAAVFVAFRGARMLTSFLRG